jgi:hypothetical protein
MHRVADKNGKIARRASKVVVILPMPIFTFLGRATKQAPIFVATQMGQSFAGDMRRYVPCEGNDHSAAPRALHFIPQSPCRGHEDLFRASLM